MTTTLQAIEAFLNTHKGANADLIARWHPGMETQVNVREGERLPDVNGIVYTSEDGTEFWHPIRIPHNSWADPFYQDRVLRFAPEEYFTNVGSTGWNWRERVSEWVAYDFDSLIGHVEGLSDDRLAEIKAAVCALPYVELRKSTSGRGFHVYVHTNILTANHTEHAHLAYVILKHIGEQVGRNMRSDVDVCGGNLWIWSLRATEENGGLSLIKPATCSLQESEIPNWRDVACPKRKHKHQASDGPVPDLDETTRQIIEDIRSGGHFAEWDERLGLLHTHTLGLQKIAHKYPGVFTTISSGSSLR